MKRSQGRLMVLLPLIVVGCAGDGSAGEADPGGNTPKTSMVLGGVGEPESEHGGTDQPWVRCKHRTQEAASDPLGPVIAHGYEEAPGFEPELLDDEQREFLSKASLRTRDDDGPNTVLYEALKLPNAEPSSEEIERWVTGAILASGKRVPAAAKLVRSRTTPENDGAGNALPVSRIWEVQFHHEGAAVAAAHCSLFAGKDEVEGAVLTCRLPPLKDALQFDAFTLTEEAAKEKALGAAKASKVVTASKRYYVSERVAQPRFVVFTDNGKHNHVVLIDGETGDVVNVEPMARNLLTFANGVSLHYEDGLEGSMTVPIDVGDGQKVKLDTMAFDANLASAKSPDNSCADEAKYPAGFVICKNGQPLDPSDPDSHGDPLTPRPLANNFGSVLPLLVPVAGGMFVPGIPVNKNGEPNENWLHAPDDNNAPMHFAELQLFHSAGLLQRRYEVIGHPDYCSTFDDPVNCPALNGQSAFRLKLTVHDPETVGSADPLTTSAAVELTSMSIGNIWDPTLSYKVEGVTDGTIVAHEYNHYILNSIEADPKNGWEHAEEATCCDRKNCERDALHEGLADAFAALLTDRNRTAPSAKPMEDPGNPCADPNAYPDNVLGDPRRNACNSVVYGYWETAPDPLLQSFQCPFELHRRGSVIFGALYHFQRRFRDAGFGYALPGAIMYDAQKELRKPHDDERVYLDALLARLLAWSSVKRHRHLALVAFEQKNVFPTGEDASCEGCTAEQAKEVALKTLAIAGPITFEESTSSEDDSSKRGPEFHIFAPHGSVYEASVTVELSDNPLFKDGSGGVKTSLLLLMSQLAPPSNNAPDGFRRYPIPADAWQPLVEKALEATEPRVYYRLIQCQQGSVNCVATSVASNSVNAGVPYVKLKLKPNSANGSSCSLRPAPSGTNLHAIAVGALLLAARRRTRKERWS